MSFLVAALNKIHVLSGPNIAAAAHKVVLTQKLGNIYPGPNLTLNKDGVVTPSDNVFYVQDQNGKDVAIFPPSISQAKPIAYDPS
jgi:hypothetical protein